MEEEVKKKKPEPRPCKMITVESADPEYIEKLRNSPELKRNGPKTGLTIQIKGEKILRDEFDVRDQAVNTALKVKEEHPDYVVRLLIY